jgi:hypothetical protein
VPGPRVYSGPNAPSPPEPYSGPYAPQDSGPYASDRNVMMTTMNSEPWP